MFEQVIFSPHARTKLEVLRRHGFGIEEKEVVDVVRRPDKVIKGGKGRFIAQTVYNERHLIRVIYEARGKIAVVVTFYPAKRERYEG